MFIDGGGSVEVVLAEEEERLKGGSVRVSAVASQKDERRYEMDDDDRHGMTQPSRRWMGDGPAMSLLLYYIPMRFLI